MNETITNDIQHDITAQVKKATKKKPAKKVKAKAPTTITGTQHRVLKVIANHALTRKGISEKAFGGNSMNFVPILTPLLKAKPALIKQIDVTPSKSQPDVAAETFFEATAAGRKLAAGPAPVRNASGEQHKSLPKTGGTITKTYLGKDITVKVTADGFAYKGKTYPSLTAAAKAVRSTDQEVNGWKFFGLTKPATK